MDVNGSMAATFGRGKTRATAGTTGITRTRHAAGSDGHSNDTLDPLRKDRTRLQDLRRLPLKGTGTLDTRGQLARAGNGGSPEKEHVKIAIASPVAEPA